LLKAKANWKKLVFDEVLFVQGMENYVEVYTHARKIITHSTLRAFAEKLPSRKFMQTHKSYIVANNKITSIEGNMLNIGTFEVPISRQLKDQVMHTLINQSR
jgi:two-component system LytT family response regulator